MPRAVKSRQAPTVAPVSVGCGRCGRSRVPAAVPAQRPRAYSGCKLCIHCFRAVVSTDEKKQDEHKKLIGG